jgi:hypothetical protein
MNVPDANVSFFQNTLTLGGTAQFLFTSGAAPAMVQYYDSARTRNVVIQLLNKYVAQLSTFLFVLPIIHTTQLDPILLLRCFKSTLQPSPHMIKPRPRHYGPPPPHHPHSHPHHHLPNRHRCQASENTIPSTTMALTVSSTRVHVVFSDPINEASLTGDQYDSLTTFEVDVREVFLRASMNQLDPGPTRRGMSSINKRNPTDDEIMNFTAAEREYRSYFSVYLREYKNSNNGANHPRPSS